MSTATEFRPPAPVRPPTPHPRPAGHRTQVARQAVVTLLFTAVQVWAITAVVLGVPAGGLTRAALAAAMGAAAITVLDAWRDLWPALRRAARGWRKGRHRAR